MTTKYNTYYIFHDIYNNVYYNNDYNNLKIIFNKKDLRFDIVEGDIKLIDKNKKKTIDIMNNFFIGKKNIYYNNNLYIIYNDIKEFEIGNENLHLLKIQMNTIESEPDELEKNNIINELSEIVYQQIILKEANETIIKLKEKINLNFKIVDKIYKSNFNKEEIQKEIENAATEAIEAIKEAKKIVNIITTKENLSSNINLIENETIKFINEIKEAKKKIVNEAGESFIKNAQAEEKKKQNVIAQNAYNKAKYAHTEAIKQYLNILPLQPDPQQHTAYLRLIEAEQEAAKAKQEAAKAAQEEYDTSLLVSNIFLDEKRYIKEENKINKESKKAEKEAKAVIDAIAKETLILKKNILEQKKEVVKKIIDDKFNTSSFQEVYKILGYNIDNKYNKVLSYIKNLYDLLLINIYNHIKDKNVTKENIKSIIESIIMELKNIKEIINKKFTEADDHNKKSNSLLTIRQIIKHTEDTENILYIIYFENNDKNLNDLKKLLEKYIKKGENEKIKEIYEKFDIKYIDDL